MKTSEMKGKAVITVPGAEIIGTVDDVLLLSVEQCVGAFVVKSDRFDGLQIVSAKDVSSIGGDAVAIVSADTLKDQTQVSEPSQLVSAVEAAGRQVATVSGNYVGKVSDIHIDPETYKITGFEVTGGLIARMFGRTHTIEVSEQTRLGRDLLIVGDVIPTPSEAPVPESR